MVSEQKKGKIGLIVIISVVIIALVAVGGYFVYQKFINSGATQKYKATDYVTISSYTDNTNTANDLKSIKFSNLSEALTVEFMRKHESFLYSTSSDYALNNTFTYDTYKNILSVLGSENIKYNNCTDSGVCNYSYDYSLNINLNTKKIITNYEMLKMFNLDIESMYKKVLTNISNTAKADKFLYSVKGDATAKSINIADFKSNISTYATYLNNRYDTVVLYIQGQKLYCAYEQYAILELLGLGTNAVGGLVTGYQTVQLN